MKKDLCINTMKLKSTIVKNLSLTLADKSEPIARSFIQKYSAFEYRKVPCRLIDLFTNDPIANDYEPILHYSIRLMNDYGTKKKYRCVIYVYKLLGITIFSIYEKLDAEKGSPPVHVPVTSFLIDHTELFYYKAKRFNNQ